MMKLTKTLLLLTLVLGACAPGVPSPEGGSATNQTATNSIEKIPFELPTTKSSNPKIIATISTPNIGQPPDGDFPTPSISQEACGYQWAYNDLPELTEQLDQTVKTLNQNSTSYATAFGENCMGANGQVVKFLAIETDFYVTLPVTDLNDHETFGNWISQVMQVVNALPSDMLMGSHSGFVQFGFEKSTSERIGLRVPIQQYNETVNGKTGEELFQMFYTQP